MGQPLWQRLLRESRRSGDDSSTDGDGARHGSANGDATSSDGDRTDVSDQVSSPDAGGGVDRAEAYAAWADRLRSHKADKLGSLDDRLQPPVEEPSAGEDPGPGAHWDRRALFDEPEIEATDPDRMGRRQLLAVLDLQENSSAGDIQQAYRTLAKRHHPDRWGDATAEVQAEHAQRMLQITAAYRHLQE